MEYLPLFLLFMAALIAAWFYLQRAKTRDGGQTSVSAASSAAPSDTAATDPTDRES